MSCCGKEIDGLEDIEASSITTSNIQVADGTVSAPSIAFTNDTNTGFYRFGNDSIGVAANGNQLMLLDSGGILCNQPVGFPNGTVSLPSMNFQSSSSTGFYRIGSNNVGLAINGVKLLDYSSNTLALLGASGATASLQVSNLNSTANSKAISKISVGGASADDPYSLYQVDSVASYAVGIDNSDSDKFKVSYNAGDDAVLGTNDQMNITANTNTRFFYPVQIPNGLLSNPSLQFSGDTNTGIYWIGAGNIGISTSGALRIDVNSLRALFTNDVSAPRIYSATATSASIANTASTTFGVSGGGATNTLSPTTINTDIYLVNAFAVGTGNYHATAICKLWNPAFTILSTISTNGFAIAISGNNIQITNNTGSATAIKLSVQAFSAGTT